MSDLLPDPDFDLLDAAVRGELDGATQERLDTRLSAEPELRSELEHHRSAVLAAERAGIADQIAQARRRQKLVQHSARVRPLSQYRFALAATFLFGLLAAGLWLYNDSRASSPQAMALTYFDAPTGLPTLLGPAEDLQFADGMVEYKLGNFEAALTRWKSLPSGDAASDTVSFYRGAASLALGRAEEAYIELGRVSRPPFDYDARWYMALALLAQDRPEEARPLLHEIEAQAGAYRDQAGDLLGEL